MAQSKRNKQVDPTQNLINQFRQVAYSLQGHLYTINTKNVSDVAALLNEYQKLSDAIGNKELSKIQASDVKEIRKIITQEQRKELRTKAAALNKEIQNEKDRLQKKSDAREQEVAKAKSEIKKLKPQVERAHREFMAIGLNKSFEMEAALARYKVLRSQLDAQARLLPDGERKEELQQLAQMSSEINQHNSSMVKEITAAKEVVNNAVEQAAKQTQNLTFEKTVLAILPGATQETVARLVGKADLPRLEGQGTAVGALALKSLPIQSQKALVTALMQELSQSDESGQSSALVEILKNGMVELLQGKKSHLSVVYELDGQIYSIHIGLEALLSNPTRYITELTMAMLRQGVGHQDRVVMTLTSPLEVAAITHMNGADYAQLSQGQSLQLLTGQILEQ